MSLSPDDRLGRFFYVSSLGRNSLGAGKPRSGRKTTMNTPLPRTGSIVCALSSVWFGLSCARGDISDVTTRASVSAAAQVAISPDATHGDPNAVRQDDRPPEEFDVTSFDKSARAD